VARKAEKELGMDDSEKVRALTFKAAVRRDRLPSCR